MALSAEDFSHSMDGARGRELHDAHLLVKFFLHPRRDAKRSKAEGRDIFKEVEYVSIMTPGNKDSIIQRPATQMDKTRFAQHYAKFQARVSDEDQVEGTLLEHWPAVTRSQVEELRFMNVRTVEQLANLSDANGQGMMGISILRGKAKSFLEAADRQAAANELEATRTQLAEMGETMRLLQEELMALRNEREEAPKPRTRGKASKAATEEDAE